MDPISVIAIFIALGSILGAAIEEGVKISSLIAPTAMLIIAGGTSGVTMACFTMEEVLGLASFIKQTIRKPSCTPGQLHAAFGEMATLARREGLLALERYQVKTDNTLLKRGVRLLVDGVDPEKLKDLLIEQIATKEDKYKTQASILATAGGFAPTMGIIGTVLGLIMVMGNLSNADELGPSIAVAFMATLYGVGSANIVLLPLGKKLGFMGKLEAQLGLMIVEGVLAIQAGDNPRMVQERLLSLIDEKHWAALQTPGGEEEKK